MHGNRKGQWLTRKNQPWRTCRYERRINKTTRWNCEVGGECGPNGRKNGEREKVKKKRIREGERMSRKPIRAKRVQATPCILRELNVGTPEHAWKGEGIVRL